MKPCIANPWNFPNNFGPSKLKLYISWYEQWDKVLAVILTALEVHWFHAKLNVAYNCIDRHLASRADLPAIIWEGDDPTVSSVLTYQMLYDRVCRFANSLKQLGVQKAIASVFIYQ